jgi:hypothetical protein
MAKMHKNQITRRQGLVSNRAGLCFAWEFMGYVSVWIPGI